MPDTPETRTYSAALYALADELDKEEGRTTEDPELIRQAAQRLDEQTVCINYLKKRLNGWIDPNDKTQKQYLPWIGEAVLFCHGGLTYYGQHTGGCFQTGRGATARNFSTWECHWMYPPAAMHKGTPA